MQKLEERNTYTPTDITQVSGNCDRILNRTETSVHAVSTYGTAIRVCDVNWRNGLEETLSVSGLKTSSNNSDASITAIEQAEQNKFVLWNKIECFVFGRRKTGYFELRTLEGTKIHASSKAKDLKLLETANTFLISYIGGVRSFPGSKPGVSATPAPHGVL